MLRLTDLEISDAEEQAGQGTGQTRKRKEWEIPGPSNTTTTNDTLAPGETYDSSKEQFPDDPWYTLEYEDITMKIGNLCDRLAKPLQEYASLEPGIQDLIDAAQAAKILPSITKLCLAVLGEQGAGKSTLVNALLDRKLLERSGGTKSCTAYATVIEHKVGADDKTQLSDINVEFLDEKEIKITVKEQILRWVEVYPGFDDDESDADGSSAEESTSERDFVDQHFQKKFSKKLTKKLKLSTETAKEFFRIIFDTKNDENTDQWLEATLYNTDISKSDFSDICFARAQARFVELGTKIDLHNGRSKFPDILDKDLAKKSTVIKKFWPFVKVVTIATGHILLRHGLCLFDLPGKAAWSSIHGQILTE